MRLTVLLPALTFLLAAGVGDASACSCQPSGPPCQNYFQSDAVFIGTVRSITPVAGAGVLERLRVEFEDAASSRGVGDDTRSSCVRRFRSSADESLPCLPPCRRADGRHGKCDSLLRAARLGRARQSWVPAASGPSYHAGSRLHRSPASIPLDGGSSLPLRAHFHPLGCPPSATILSYHGCPLTFLLSSPLRRKRTEDEGAKQQLWVVG